MSDEDKEFYGRGWIKPTELDAPAVHHSTADPNETATKLLAIQTQLSASYQTIATISKMSLVNFL